MSSLYTRFTHSLRWNALESVIYQVALLAHQAALYKVLGATEYGIVSLIFAVTFLAADQLNLGLAASLGPFFTSITRSRAQFKKIFFIQCVTQLPVIAGILWLLYLVPIGSWVPTVLREPYFYCMMSAIVILEFLKKNFRTVLQLAFLNKKTASLELVTVFGYFAATWLMYFFGFPFNYITIFIPYFFYALVNVLALSRLVQRFYTSLPTTTGNSEWPVAGIDTPSWNRIIKSRITNTAHRISIAPFSGNFLTPLIAATCGVEQAGILTLTSYVAYCISVVVHKIFDITSDALLAHLKNATHVAKQQAFALISRRLYGLLGCIVLFLLLTGKHILAATQQCYLPGQWYFFALVLSLKLLDLFFIAYERFLIIEEQLQYLVALRFLVIICIYGTISYLPSLDTGSIIMLAIAGKSITLLLISIYARYRWRIFPSLFNKKQS